MKICFLGDAASIHIRRWCEFFRDKGDDVSIISFNNAEIPGIKVYFVGDKLNINGDGGNIAYLKKVRVIKKLLKKVKPDIVNAHYLTSYGLIGTLINCKPFIVSTWGSDVLVTPKKNIVYNALTRFVISKASLITSDSNFMSKEIISLGGKIEKVITAPMGINNIEFNNKDENRKEKTFLSMRTLCDNSNVDCILRAFKMVLAVYRDAKLIITNSGEKKDDIINLIKELDLQNNVEYLGFINRETVKELLKTSSIYISIPTSDSTSVTLLEGMASGIFPIVSNLPANKEWITHNKNGYILKNIDEKELSKLMISSLENEEIKNYAKDINEKIINERAIWEDNMTFIREKYIKVLMDK
ncbi:glycosyltransferase family 4 protein [Clostridium sp.]|uniref:glycosyltransferase family 4 protein n=1 Tax=Clostridium sp. TaxID=1506 RepID=UPI0025BDEF4C|nr:glycosyltransferase family 4 protein [Clostridium sp.]